MSGYKPTKITPDMPFFKDTMNKCKVRHKRAEEIRRNVLRIQSCKLHEFDIVGAIKREKMKQEKFGVILGNVSSKWFICRCKNCGGKMALWYAQPYMDARRAMEQSEGGAK